MEQYRKSPRAIFLDYDGGDFFITICTRDRMHYFGEIVDGHMIMSEVGEFLTAQLSEYSLYIRDVEIPLFTVMPNHLHAIVHVKGEYDPDRRYDNREQRSVNPHLRSNPAEPQEMPKLSTYIRSLKGAVTKFAKSHGIEFAWQSRYHDHYIRNAHDGNNIAEYIINNVARWDKDCFY